MNEFQLIKQYFQQTALAFSNEYASQGIGDDCASILIPSDYELQFSIDTLVEGVHFPKNANPFDIATRAVAVSISDLAAMAATPIGFTLAITLPELNEVWLKSFSEGLTQAAQFYQCPLMGGDTTKGPNLVISLQVHGVTKKGESLKRSGAKTGDNVYVSGPLGDGAGALSLVLENPRLNTGLAKQFYSPLAQVEFAQTIKTYATSCLDISDGLVQDLNHLCTSGTVGMKINPADIPLSDLLVATYGKEQALQYALEGGDDYQLAYTAKHCEHGICIGEVLKGNVVQVNGMEVKAGGYQHF
ncbi:thiamine-phosphate kinase [Oceaniserpentilla sp. 4NH20-0058]|uniref:thiamine-phosphate kinase n=1 Tax=Oceaniserpentilla sp. 4NH20-0058 TaxID=3127660 RepID=UPI00310B89C6